MSGPVELRIAHATIIQGVIDRVASFSANAKNFCITICAAVVGFALQSGMFSAIWAVAPVIVVFLLLDAFYLSQEKRFRDLYDDVASGDLNRSVGLALEPPPLTVGRFLRAMRSISVGPFYGMLMAAMIAGGYIAHDDGPEEHETAERGRLARENERTGTSGVEHAGRGSESVIGQPATASAGRVPPHQ